MIEPAAGGDTSPATDPALGQITAEVSAIRADIERVAAHLVPLLDTQYRRTENQIRELERTVLHRQERPVAVRLGHLLADLHRLTDARDARAHAIEGIEDVLFQMGYEQFGEIDEPFDDTRHEAVAGSGAGGNAAIAEVFTKGLWSFGDVVVRARVSVRPKDIDTTLEES